jgi:stage V sporulation protein SpoVS
MRVLQVAAGPPRLEPALLPAAFAGAFVGVRLGGWRGLLCLVAFASVGVVRYLTYPIGAALDCARGVTEVCRGATDFDFVVPQAWLLPGFVAGVLAAVMTRARVPLRVELEALGAVAFLPLVGYALPLSRGFDAPSVFDVLGASLGLLAAAIIMARRSSDPMRSGFIVASALLLLAVPYLTYILWFNSDPAQSPWNQWMAFAAPVALVVATYAMSRHLPRT